MVEERSRITQQAGVLGLAFVILFVVGFAVGGATPAYDAPDQEWTDWFDDSGNRSLYLVGIFLIVLASLALLSFAVLISTLLRDRGSDRGTWAPLALASGTAAAIFIILAALITGAIASALTLAPDFDQVPSADVLKAIEQVGFGILLVGGGWTAAMFVATVSAAARGTGVLPGWLVTTGFVVAALLLLSFFFLPFFLFPLWMLVVSVILLRSPRPAGTGSPATA
jgi:hypothetical protein